ncbi:hypothetical protein ACCS72_38825, partial [Rhizobium ruizarguesonis]
DVGDRSVTERVVIGRVYDNDVDDGKPEAVWVTEQIRRPIIKAWNAVLSATLAEKGVEKSQPGRIALPVAGDDLEKKLL